MGRGLYDGESRQNFPTYTTFPVLCDADCSLQRNHKTPAGLVQLKERRRDGWLHRDRS